MCGVTGFLDPAGTLGHDELGAMINTLDHRGPDDRGTQVSDADRGARVGLGHARLSIIDLSPGGHQPMTSGPLSIVFNGEIYNYRELREALRERGHTFHSNSDTEVILAGFREWGIGCLSRLLGMFAFALHDADARRLYLVRDRAGVKPLFVYRPPSRDVLLFASELKAFHACGRFSPSLDAGEVLPFFDYGYVPDDRCIFEHCHKVDAGHYWTVDVDTLDVEVQRYWSVIDAYRQPKLALSYPEAVDEVERLLKSATAYRMVADVPVGVFLSGGYDSTAVAALIQSEQSAKLKTFTIGFEEGNNEAPFARQTAAHLGTDHHELTCTEREALDIIPDLPTIFDEPFADSSAIPTLLVSRMAREHVKVALSADAGDEVFCGYSTYMQLHRRMRRLARLPWPLVRAGAKLGLLLGREPLARASARTEHMALGLLQGVAVSPAATGERLHAFAKQLPGRYRRAMVVRGDDGRYLAHEPLLTSGDIMDDGGIEGAMALDYATYLKDDILVKVDRATMACGLEGREPLLDHRLIELAARLPLAFKLEGGVSKRILRDVVHRYVPASMMNRPKAGFSLPITRWLRGPLRPLLEEVCSEEAIAATGFLNPAFWGPQLRSFKEGTLWYTPMIWRLFVLLSWTKRWL